MSRIKKFFLTLSIACVFASPSFASATLIENVELPELVQTAKFILIGRVIDIQTQWNSNNTRIISLITVEVTQSIKGKTPTQITLQALGGSLAGITQRVQGEASFVVGEKILVFLEENEQNFRTSALSLGKFSIVSKNGIEYALSYTHGLHFSPTASKRTIQPAEQPLEDFVTQIHGYLNASYESKH